MIPLLPLECAALGGGRSPAEGCGRLVLFTHEPVLRGAPRRLSLNAPWFGPPGVTYATLTAQSMHIMTAGAYGGGSATSSRYLSEPVELGRPDVPWPLGC